MTLLGNRFIRNVAVRKASSQYLRGIDALARRASHGDVFSQQNHFVGGHGGKIHDE
jgi:hypothetical protein